MKSTQA
jgi:hypothetical protein